jgi:hypothetical protein
MIKFFRKIRQNLLMENKTGKYFKYAIGEIALVVIGILIALSINNWNEQNKSNLKEVKILRELKNDLKSNYQELSTIKEMYSLEINKTDSLRERLNNKSFDINIHSNLLAYINYRDVGIFNISNTAFKFIENSGFELLTNDKLRISISDIYTRSIHNVLHQMNEFQDFYKGTTWPYIRTRFYFYKNEPALPINLKTLYEQEFFNIINQRKFILLNGSQNIDSCIKDIETLIKEVEKEIAILKK